MIGRYDYYVIATPTKGLIIMTITAYATATLRFADGDAPCQGRAPGSLSAPFTCRAADGETAIAIHTVDGINLCAYHSPFDNKYIPCTSCGEKPALAGDSRDEDPVCADCEAAYARIADLPAPTPTMPAPTDLITQDGLTFPAWFQGLLALARPMPDPDAFEATAYRGHLNYEIGGTDGYYAPEPIEAWVIGFRQAPISSLYRGNDLRNELAPQALAYCNYLNISPR